MATSHRPSQSFTNWITWALWIAAVSATPAPRPNPVAEAHPEITPFRASQYPTRTIERRADIISKLDGAVNSALSALGSNVPSYVASGIPQFFQEFPSPDNVKSSLGINDTQLQALPTQVLNLPPYGNWTDAGWSIRFRGNVYKQPNTSIDKLNSLANLFIIGADIKNLPPQEQMMGRNVTAEIFVVQQGNVNVTMNLTPAPSAGGDGEPGGGGGIPATGGNQSLSLPYPTTPQGDFDVFVPIQQGSLMAGNQTQAIQRLNVYANGSDLGNGTAYLVPPTGFTVISDIDDILRVTQIWRPGAGLINNTFIKPFVPWMNMPEVYRNWSQSIPNTHFHYLTTTPEQITRNYMDFIFKTYPGGSFDTRPLNFSDIKATLSIRKFLLNKIFDTYPNRKFILVADTSNSDVMSDYPELGTTRPNQVQCILLRNTSATDSSLKFPYNTKGFKGIPQNKYMFFRVPDDLKNLDITGGNCYNASIPQNVTFGYQAELLGIYGSGAAGLRSGSASFVALVVGMFASLWLFL